LHTSKFIPQNSVRISSTRRKFKSVAFKTPAGKIALIVLNDGAKMKHLILNIMIKWQQLLYLQTL
jgi:glucosylceramidase